MTASEIGKIAPAPRPWRPRKTMSCHISWLQAAEQRAEKEEATPIIIIGRRPNWSDSFP